MSNFEDVKTFMEAFGQMVRTKPQFPDNKTMELRFDLMVKWLGLSHNSQIIKPWNFDLI